MSSSIPKRAPNPLDRRRRRYVRYRADFRVSVNHLLGDHYQEVEGHCRDLSEAGIGILLATELSLGEVGSLSMTFPGADSPWEPRAVVRHRRGYQYGFEFLALSSEQRDALTKYLQALEREEGLE